MTLPERIFFVGIGGIGMSALARCLKHRGHYVRGYDRSDRPLTRQLQQEGIGVEHEARSFGSKEFDLFVYTPAIKPGDAVFDAAAATGAPMLKRAQVLGMLSQSFRCLAVAGTHGKTTTSSLLASLLHEAGMDPVALVGGIMANYGSNWLQGSSDLLVVEADEFDRSFLHLQPSAAILTSTDPDHLDVYGTAQEVEKSYREFIHLLPPEGLLLLEHSLKTSMAPHTAAACLTYGIGEGDVRAENVRFRGLKTVFDLHTPDAALHGLVLPMPGRHNLLNAVAALGMALWAGTPAGRLAPALARFAGIERRFQVWLDTPELTFIDDYAHHPSELKSAISAARELFPNRQLIACFQPHLYSRTRDFYREFGEVLSLADDVLLIHIYPARELSIPNVTADLVYQHIFHERKRLLVLNQLPDEVLKTIRKPSVILTLGAGDIDTQVPILHLKLQGLLSS